MKNKKSLGQNWLKDSDTLRAIAGLAELKSDDSVLEIGPGLGYLTDKLLVSGAKVTALEFDQDLVPKLEKKYKDHNNKPELIEGDIRKFNFSDMPVGFKICANIPYYLTANLMRLLTETDNKPSRAVLLVQKEVAEKICSQGKRSMLNSLISFWFSAELGPVVKPELFEPAPKVDSQVLLLNLKKEPLMSAEKWQDYVQLLKIAYSNPRKKLRANLASGLRITKEQADKMLQDAVVDKDIRAEQLEVNKWGLLLKT